LCYLEFPLFRFFSFFFRGIHYFQLSSASVFHSIIHKSLAMAASTKATKLLQRKSQFTSITTRCLSSQTLPRQSTYAPNYTSTEKYASLDSTVISSPPAKMPKPPPLCILPLSSLFRSLATTTISSSPVSLLLSSIG
jgi:hypothetical protein